MILSKHILDYCPGCECEMVRCVTCNNNCCNASFGPKPGIDMSCPDCPEAHDHQSMYWKDKTFIQFAGKRNIPFISFNFG